MAQKKQGSSTGHLIVHDEPRVMEKPKPTLRLSEDELPEIKNHTPGKKYHLHLEVEMRSHSKGDRYGMDEKGEKKKHEGEYVVTSAKEHNEDE